MFFDRYESAYPHNDDGKIDFKSDQGILEPVMALLAAGMVTEHIRLGTSVEILTERNPVVRGRELMTLDVATGGLAWSTASAAAGPAEYAALGIAFERRGARLDEYIQALRILWSQSRPTFHGEFVDFADIVFEPKPVRSTIPIVIGGNSPAALRRVARLGDGWHGWKLGLEELSTTLDALHAESQRCERSCSDVKLNIGIPFKGDPTELGAYAEACRELGMDESGDRCRAVRRRASSGTARRRRWRFTGTTVRNHEDKPIVEQMYPFPQQQIEGVLGRYRRATPEVYWVQEEPRNMGPWRFHA